MIRAIRLSASWIIGAGLVVLIPLVLLGEVTLDARIDESLVDGFFQTVGTFVGISTAALFLTAQIQGGEDHRQGLGGLYSSPLPWSMLLTSAVALAGGYLVLMTSGQPWSDTEWRLLQCAVVIGIASMLLVVPVVALQIENMDLLKVLEAHLRRLSSRGVVEYGLTSVELGPGGRTALGYGLQLYGIRPRGIDPLRPIHEVIMVAVEQNDRVLLGQMLRRFVGKVTLAYRQPMPSPEAGGVESGAVAHKLVRARLWATPNRLGLAEQIHLTLIVCHYLVKRSRRLRTEWNGRDTGRHGTIVSLTDATTVLARSPSSRWSVRICLFAVLHVTDAYKAFAPQGPREPLLGLFDAASALEAAGMRRESMLAMDIAGWSSAHTQQLSPTRCPPSVVQGLSDPLRQEFRRARRWAQLHPGWVPSDSVWDPWHDPQNLN